MEGDRDHTGQLSASVHPEVPASPLLTPKLLQTHHLDYTEPKEPKRVVTVFRYVGISFNVISSAWLAITIIHSNTKASPNKLNVRVVVLYEDLIICAICSNAKAMQLGSERVCAESRACFCDRLIWVESPASWVNKLAGVTVQ